MLNQKRGIMKNLKIYFLITNIVLSIVAFSWMVGAQVPSATLPVRNPSPEPSFWEEFDAAHIEEEIGFWEEFDKAYIPPTTPTPTEVPAVINLEDIDPSSEPIITGETPKIKDPSSGLLTPFDQFKVSIPAHEFEEELIYGIERNVEGKYNLLDQNGKIVSTANEQQLINSNLDPSRFIKIDGKMINFNGAEASTINVGGKQIDGLMKGDNFLSPDDKVLYKNVDEKWVKAGEPITSPTKLTSKMIIDNAIQIGMMFGIGYMVGGFIGGNANIALGSALAAATFVWQAAGEKALWGTPVQSVVKKITFGHPTIGGVVIGAIIFVVMYKKTDQEIVEFNCLPYQPPIGGGDCEKCNIFGECSEYRCKSLGQACELLNAGTEDEKCTWVNPRDVNSPMIKVEHVLEGYKWVPDTAVRPPATGVVISQVDGSCVETFTALEFTLLTDEPSQCKIDYNLTHNFDEMSYYIGGSNLFSYNHTEEMSLPGPDAINAIAPELQNDGTYTLYARCQDANGNFNQDAFSVRFCVKPGPDTTPPKIEAVNVPSNSPINYEKTELNLEVYVNEPSECKWSKTDTSFDNMENTMICDTNLWEMNNQNVYTCRTTLTGIQDRKENSYYFKCKDQPNEVEGNRNVNTQSYLYNIIGTQPLNILSIGPNETIRGSTDTIPVLLVVKTDNGYKNGEAVCYYSTTNEEEDYIEFLETGGNTHEQRQDLDSGAYTYYYKCVDLGGNTAYDSTSFNVEVDRQGPFVVRAYKSSGELKIITNEKAECAYSNKDCNFDIDEGIQMTTLDNEAHNSEWKTTKNYYIRCKDEYDNQPPLNVDAVGCSIVVRPYEIMANEGVIEL